MAEASSFHRRIYGCHPNGEEIEEITLVNANGWMCKVLSLGGIITELHVPDRQGRLGDVVLCFNNLEDMVDPEGWPYFGCIVGRVAGRISGGRFQLEGKEVHLEQNDGPNHLHGGRVGLDKRIWKARPYMGKEGPSVELRYVSHDGEEGYPGLIDLSVTYTLSDAGELRIVYKGMPDQKTPLCLTNHSYFNLAGSREIDDHVLKIMTQKKIHSDSHWGLEKKVSDVGGTPEDFSQGRRMGDVLNHPHQEHCGLYFFGEKVDEPRVVAILEDPESGRHMEVFSTESGVQLYCGCYLEGQGQGKGELGGYPSHAGLCLETQGYPNGVNAPEIEDILVSPESPYHQETVFRFSIKGEN